MYRWDHSEFEEEKDYKVCTRGGLRGNQNCSKFLGEDKIYNIFVSHIFVSGHLAPTNSLSSGGRCGGM